MALIIRAARVEDLADIYDIAYCNEIAGIADPPPRGDVPADLRHIFQTGSVYVCEDGKQLTGFAAAVRRGDSSFLTDLFVRSASQSSGQGRALLAAALPKVSGVRFTVSSADPRALALYVREGLLPCWPHFNLARQGRGKHFQTPDVAIERAEIGDPAIVAWDANVSGRNRPDDHVYWVREQQATPLWFRRHGRTIGYCYVRSGAGSIMFPEACAIGPIGVEREADAGGCVLAAVDWASGTADRLHIDIPASHPALAPLLEAGFRITYVETFMSDTARLFFSPRRYVPSGSNLF